MLLRSQLDRLTEPDVFLWATGIEDTFITDPWPATGRTLDEYELTGHYDHWHEDLGLMAELSVSTARYGIPWHRVNPGPDRWEWGWADRALERLLELRIDPIVDLVHYGVPPWLKDGFLNPEFPERVAEYARRLAERFHGRVRWYTPLNEPRITAWYCGRLGWWPPYARGWSGFVRVMLAICRGIVRTAQALRDVDPEVVLVHVDATDLYTALEPDLQEEANRRQHIGFLALDLVSGRVGEDHPLWTWLAQNGATPADLEWFRREPIHLDVVGLNMYPMFSNKLLVRTGRSVRFRMPYGSPELVERLVERYWQQYRRPMLISETAARGSRRQAWLDGSVGAIRRLRERGIPLCGYTWWPMYALVAWAYRQGGRPVHAHLEQMGLWNLEASPDGDLRRVRTSLVDSYQALAAGGSRAVGGLAKTAPARG